MVYCKDPGAAIPSVYFTIMISEQLKASLMRTLKGSVAAGLAQVTLALSSQTLTITSLADVAILTNVVVTSFVTGAILGFWKYMSWKETI